MIKDRKAVVDFSSPHEVLISTVLSQRTKDKITFKVSKQLFLKYKTLKSLQKAKIQDIEKIIRPVNYYKGKSRKIKQVANILVKKYKGKVPGSIQKLISLPGVGRKTASCVLIYSFGKPAIAVDTHVHRVFNRLGIIKTKNSENTENVLMKLLPKELWLEANNLFVRFGQQVCLPKKPLCDEFPCKLRDRCLYYKITLNKK